MNFLVLAATTANARADPIEAALAAETIPLAQYE
jgi:hypothetical protein